MSSVTQPVTKQARQNTNTRTVKDWLDTLATGGCDQPQFLRSISEIVRKTPDAGWELLGLIDQYYRRGKLSAQTFGTLKTHLQGLMVGRGSDEVSSPPRMQDEPVALPPPSARATPAKSAAPAASSPAAVAPPATVAVSDAMVVPATMAVPAAVKPVSAPVIRAPVAPRSMPQGARAAPARQAPGARPPPDPSPRSLAVGDVLRGRYIVQGLVGQGGMGTVYAAIDQFRLDRSDNDQKVALKVLHTEVIKRPRLFAELRREFQHLQSLSHPNVVRVHEFDRDGDLAFFTMEFLSGALLSKVLSAQPTAALHRPYALAIIRDVGSAVAHAHSRGVVHGDLNPGNIFVSDTGEVRVLDFGASHQLRRGPWISEFTDQEHVPVATRGFASCQVLSGETADARDDVFALACVAYVLLTGDNPFQDNTALKARTLQLVPLRPRGLTGRQWHALRAGLHFDRDRRPSDIQEWVNQLDLRGAVTSLPPLLSLATGRPRRRNGNSWLRRTALVAAVVAGATWIAVDIDFPPGAHDFAARLYQSTLSRTPAGITEDAATVEVAGDAAPPEVTVNTPAAPAVPQKTPPAQARANPGALNDAPGKTTLPVASMPQTTVHAPVRPAAAASLGGSAVAAGVQARIELAADNVEVPPADAVAHIVVKRSRSLRGDVSFTWWTESGTAKPGRDFVPVAAHEEHIDNGQSALSLVIPVVVDPTRRMSRSFYVVIDQPSDNATLGSHTLTMVTMPGSEPDPPTTSDDP